MCLNITEMATKEINKYFQEKRTNINEDPLAFWRVQKNEFPLLSKLARIFLSPPPSSSASEREFKISKSLQKDRIKLLPKNLELLLFLKYNLRSINYCTDLPEVSKNFIPPNSISALQSTQLDLEDDIDLTESDPEDESEFIGF